jgi:hypothetical protein
MRGHQGLLLIENSAARRRSVQARKDVLLGISVTRRKAETSPSGVSRAFRS